MQKTIKQKDQEVIELYRKKEYWGLSVCIDLKNCNPDIIRDEKKVKEFTIKLCDLIEMRRYGDVRVVDFGDDPRVSGFSMTQLIETSLVSGHFANQSNAAYLDIFSCKEYEPYKAAEFCKEFFEADSYKVLINFRL